ncbi:MAG TPA: tetratricopeptide repeat protein [Bryobacteraceae bacterium]|nr:tetratricopeptide repeat protein [Bryobacteraceae bacterium]
MAKAQKKSVSRKLDEQPVPIARPLLWMAAAGIVLACVLIYAQTGSHEFINYDDPNYVVTNTNVNRGLTAQGIRWAFTTFDFYYWQPLTWISHMLDVQMFGMNAGRHHLESAALHAVNAVLLLVALRLLTGCLWRSAFAAALFALHPLRVESVAWVAERKDVLSGLFWMLTLITYALYVRKPSRRGYAAVLAAFLCAVMSKPSVVTLPFVLLLLDWWPLNRMNSPAQFWPRLREKLPMLAVVAASSLWTFLGQQQMGATVSLNALPFYFRTWNALLSYVRYLGKFLWPADLGVLYPYGKISASEVLGAFLLLTIITALVIWRSRRSPYLATGWFWFAGAMVPMIGLAQTGVQAMADRFTYLPMIGLAILVSWGFGELFQNWNVPLPLRFGAGGLALGILSFASFIQTTHWKNSVTLFEHTIAATSNNDVMHLNLAGMYQDMGRLDLAAPHFEAALQIEPNNVEGRNLLAGLYLRKRDYAKAEQHLLTVLKVKPDHREARKQLAECYLQTGRREEARTELIRVLRESPNDFEARTKMILLDQRR